MLSPDTFIHSSHLPGIAGASECSPPSHTSAISPSSTMATPPCCLVVPLTLYGEGARPKCTVHEFHHVCMGHRISESSAGRSNRGAKRAQPLVIVQPNCIVGFINGYCLGHLSKKEKIYGNNKAQSSLCVLSPWHLKLGLSIVQSIPHRARSVDRSRSTVT